MEESESAGNKRSDFRLSTRLGGMRRCQFARHEEAAVIPPTVRPKIEPSHILQKCQNLCCSTECVYIYINSHIIISIIYFFNLSAIFFLYSGISLYLGNEIPNFASWDVPFVWYILACKHHILSIFECDNVGAVAILLCAFLFSVKHVHNVKILQTLRNPELVLQLITILTSGYFLQTPSFICSRLSKIMTNLHHNFPEPK